MPVVNIATLLYFNQKPQSSETKFDLYRRRDQALKNQLVEPIKPQQAASGEILREAF